VNAPVSILSTEIRDAVSYADRVLRAVPEQESYAPVLSGGWSRKQVLGHLIDSACNNHQRFVRGALQDVLEFPAYDQDGWSRVQAVEQMPWLTLVSLWVSYNQLLAHVIEKLPESHLNVLCHIGTSEPVTLEFIAQDYLRHLLHHLKQIGAVDTK
jgi:hypothetical protein